MSSDSEIDDLQHFEASRQRALAAKAGISQNQFEEYDMSDEEVLGLGSGESSEEEEGQDAYYEQDDQAINAKRDRTYREQEDNWGQTRDDYFGGEDDIGADEGASEEEEQEALRLRQRELEEMEEGDFVNEDDMEGWKQQADTDEHGDIAQEEVTAFDPSSMSASERKELLEEKFPAVILLSAQLQKLNEWEADFDTSSQPEDVIEIGRSALSTYRGMIYAYFALFTDRIQKGDMKGLLRLEEHPVNEGLLMARQLWLNYQQIDPPTELEDKNNEHELEAALGALPQQQVVSDDEEMEESGAESDIGQSPVDSDFMNSEKDVDSDVDEFTIAKPTSAMTSKTRNVVGDFDETADTIEQQARAKNKQSLRFYTSQIGKNDAAPKDSYSGDVDLPYREREFERRMRLMEKAQKRGQQQKDRLGDEADKFGDDYDGSENGSLDFYAKAQSEMSDKRVEKQELHAEAVRAAREGRLVQYLSETPNVDKRAINYQIEKNKGLTRKRKKENRNARIKKRIRYEAAQKKLKGVRREYKGQEWPYQGELTGIRKNLTHSTKFKS